MKHFKINKIITDYFVISKQNSMFFTQISIKKL